MFAAHNDRVMLACGAETKEITSQATSESPTHRRTVWTNLTAGVPLRNTGRGKQTSQGIIFMSRKVIHTGGWQWEQGLSSEGLARTASLLNDDHDQQQSEPTAFEIHVQHGRGKGSKEGSSPLVHYWHSPLSRKAPSEIGVASTAFQKTQIRFTKQIVYLARWLAWWKKEFTHPLTQFLTLTPTSLANIRLLWAQGISRGQQIPWLSLWFPLLMSESLLSSRHSSGLQSWFLRPMCGSPGSQAIRTHISDCRLCWDLYYCTFLW